MTKGLSKTRMVPRRGLSRIEAAQYLGISTSKFDEMRAHGRIPSPRVLDARKLWDVIELDMAFEALPREDAPRMGTGWEDI